MGCENRTLTFHSPFCFLFSFAVITAPHYHGLAAVNSYTVGSLYLFLKFLYELILQMENPAAGQALGVKMAVTLLMALRVLIAGRLGIVLPVAKKLPFGAELLQIAIHRGPINILSYCLQLLENIPGCKTDSHILLQIIYNQPPGLCFIFMLHRDITIL